MIIKTVPSWKLLLVLPLLLLTQFAAGQAIPTSGKDAPNLVLLEVQLGPHMLADSLPAYQYGDDVFLPLGELSRLLTIAIKTQPLEGRAGGYILTEERSFGLDVMQREATLNGKPEPVERANFKLQADDIYVASRLLARWLPVDLKVDLSNLALVVNPREPLPLQARLGRNERGTLSAPRGAYVDPDYPRYSTPYRMIDTPFIDQTLGADLRRVDGKSIVGAAYSGYLTADLMGLETALHLSSTRLTPKPLVRLTVGRNDPDAGLLGPLHARTVQVGNVLVPSVSNISRGGGTGNGVLVSNRPLNQPTSFDSHSLNGDLPPGWDVELYFNDALVGFQQSRADGKYSFADMPLIYGPNEFRLVFHGPLGQLRVERQSFLLEQSAVPQGSVFYSVSGQRDEFGKQRTAAQFELGLFSHLSASGGMATLPGVTGVQRYTNLGLRGYLNAFILGADVARADNGGTLAQANVKTRVAGMAVSASHSQLQDFSSDVFQPSGGLIRSRDEIRVDGVLPVGRLPMSVQLKRDKLDTGIDNVEAIARLSAYRFGTAISNTLRWQSFGGTKFADAIVQASRRVAGIGINGQLQYSIEPKFSLSSIALGADKSLDDGYLLNLGVTHAFERPQSRLTASLNKSLGSFGLGVNGYFSNRGDYGAGVQLFVALGVEPRQSRVIIDAQPMAATGAASVRVFLDKNLNGVMDADEEPVKGAGFTINGGATQARTDENGIAYLRRLPANQKVDIGFDPSTLEDPQLLATQKGVRVVPRPGKVTMHDFPISVTGEIDGTTYLLDHDVKRAAADLELELVDVNHKVVGTTKSAADGYFVIGSVVPGNYLLRVSRDQLKRLGMSDMGMHLVTIAPDGAFVNGTELYVESNRTTASAAP